MYLRISFHFTPIDPFERSTLKLMSVLLRTEMCLCAGDFLIWPMNAKISKEVSEVIIILEWEDHRALAGI